VAAARPRLRNRCGRGKRARRASRSREPHTTSSIARTTSSSPLDRANDKQLAARAKVLAELVDRRCTADAWSIELRRCVAGAKTVDEATTCDKLATPEQRSAFADDLEATIVTEDGQ
jgi:hypothetical protein